MTNKQQITIVTASSILSIFLLWFLGGFMANDFQIIPSNKDHRIIIAMLRGVILFLYIGYIVLETDLFHNKKQ